MDTRYDIAIVGSGPAGLSAAINAKIRNKNIIVFGSSELSGKLIKAPKIDNYLGLPGITGIQLKDRFQQHVANMGINITYERINTIYAMGQYFGVAVNEKMYEASAVILATGIEYTKALKGEEEFLGRGVGYCATCDAPLYRGKVVTIIGYNKEAEAEANYVNELSKKTYYIPMYKESLNLSENIEVVRDKVVEISGGNKVEKVILKSKEIVTDGVFVLKDSIAPDKLVPGLIMENGHIKVDMDMKTNIEGCFAAGDCVGRPYQYMKAAGQGQVAALNAVFYIDKN
ncbi:MULTISPECIES: NAD(P)/FAD-dependent oxidoreductase [Clostridium]|jgi:thioredoxin reductase (NADPH)|uniref:Thioredoxin reductase n=4 Tax=Clostridium TaxID=1485 RepID=D8GIJ9_CLOLD|nr:MULTISPECIES: NAD(P)/FAD-dependent oxidoreductase [Clostridium]ADK17073.1 thioredoxin reductase [Clostridium ljungdahlii DSM 13528]AGY76111.1 NAD(P)/FAD-dependent oxidoreductase [Clostridium autoethanogenum DSM 10061]ALU36273.1 Thioredoxin-disulfide reductase [Clostridium autoethanogenum DSM 10061]OAA85161.1 Thioredoxin reductase [Clostridium ljungdahlii DSM 13528]OAA94866.1 Thioredoxin reductase [Clostridium coskatii]